MEKTRRLLLLASNWREKRPTQRYIKTLTYVTQLSICWCQLWTFKCFQRIAAAVIKETDDTTEGVDSRLVKVG